jgi:hypothetical protein
MGEIAAGRDGPGWLGLGWVGSGVVGGAAAGVVLGAALGVLLAATSDRSPDDVAAPELPLLLGTALGAAALLPAGVVGGLLLGLVLRAQAHGRGTTPWRSALTGLVLGAALVPVVAVVLGMVADPSAAPGLPPLPVVVVPAVVAGAAGVGLALLMERSATRLGAWPS